MAMFTSKTEAQRAAEQADKQAALQKRVDQKADQAWWDSPAGRATNAFERGDEFFQIEIPHSTLTGHANAAWGTAQRTRQHGPATDTLGQIETMGWRLEHASWVYIQTGENSRDKFLASGQQTVVSGHVSGIYLFRRWEDEDEQADQAEQAG